MSNPLRPSDLHSFRLETPSSRVTPQTLESKESQNKSEAVNERYIDVYYKHYSYACYRC